MVSKPAYSLTLLALTLIVTLSVCIRLTNSADAVDLAEKRRAVELATAAHTILSDRLPGPEYSLITTTLGSLDAKQLSLLPDFAAVAVDLLHQAGIREGDRVALNMSGSFPGLNIAVLAAIRAIGCDAVLVSSVGASTWGATNPQDTWLDMEQSLLQAGVWPWRSAAASPGGVGDRGGGLSREGLEYIRLAMLRNAVPALGSTNLSDGVSLRLALYRDAFGRLPDALVNIGGSHVIFGKSGHAAPLRQGLTVGYRATPAPPDSLAAPFLNANRPVIHFINVRRLAAKYQIAQHAQTGSSKVFSKKALSPSGRILAITSLAAVVFVLWRKGRDGHWQLPSRKLTGG